MITTKNYFSIDRNGKTWGPVMLMDANGNVAFEDVMSMSYDEIVAYSGIEDFVFAAMEAASAIDDGVDTETYITLIDESDGCFIWSVVIGPGEDGHLMYNFIDWRKDGNHFRYAEE